MNRSNATTTVAIAAAAIAVVCYWSLNRTGIGLSPDGWAYWQGAASLADGDGYRYFSGAPIVAWPPLYSIYLAAWILVTGPGASGLVIANGLLIGLQAALWTWTLDTIWQDEAPPASSRVRWAAALYIGLFLAAAQPNVLADVLKLTLAAPFVWCLWKLLTPDRNVAILPAVGAVILGTLLLTTHNGAVAIVGAAAVIILVTRRVGNVARRARLAAIVSVPPVALWWAAQLWLGQRDSHPIGLGVAAHSPQAYVMHIIYGVGDLAAGGTGIHPVIPAVIFGAWIAWLVVINRLSAAVDFSWQFVTVWTAITFFLFNVTHVVDPLNGRFLLQIPLMLVPILWFAASRRGAAIVALSLSALLVPLVIGTTSRLRANAVRSLDERGFPERWVPLNATIVRDGTPGTARWDGGSWQVTPPVPRD